MLRWIGRSLDGLPIGERKEIQTRIRLLENPSTTANHIEQTELIQTQNENQIRILDFGI